MSSKSAMIVDLMGTRGSLVGFGSGSENKVRFTIYFSFNH